MPPNTQDETNNLHRLCLEKIDFFRQALAEVGYIPLCSTEREVFFEDDKGHAIHPDRLKVVECLESALGSNYHYFGNDLIELDKYELHNPAKDHLYAWGKTPCVKPYTKAPFVNPIIFLSAKAGIQHKLLSHVARQYEVEIHSGNVLTNEVMREFLEAAAHIDKALNTASESLNYSRTSAQSKPYSYTLGHLVTPSMHINVSLWKKAEYDPKSLVNDFRSRYSTKISDVIHYKPPEIAVSCMQSMVCMQKLGLPFFMDTEQSEISQRFSRNGYQNPRIFGYSTAKNSDYGVCYRANPLTWKEQEVNRGEYAHIENRIAPANCDPYMAMVMTFAALYIGVCKREELPELENQAEKVQDKLTAGYKMKTGKNAVDKVQESEMLKAILGEPLFTAALKYYGLDKMKSQQSGSNAR